MPARKKPIGFNQRHFDAKQIMELLDVRRSKAYDIIHECKPYGSVIKSGRTLRVSEEALTKWYEQQKIDAFRKIEDDEPRRRGRPRKDVSDYGIYAAERF